MVAKPKAPLHIVRISEAALVQLSLAALEGYLVPHNVGRARRSGVEISGHLWGKRGRLSDVGGGARIVDFVDMAAIETSAERTTNSVESHDAALTLKCDVMTTFWPHLEFMGDFHTHPFRRESVASVEQRRAYRFSDEDRIVNERMVRRFGDAGYRLSLVASIAHTNRSIDTARFRDGAVRFSLGGWTPCGEGGRRARWLGRADGFALWPPGRAGRADADRALPLHFLWQAPKGQGPQPRRLPSRHPAPAPGGRGYLTPPP